MFVVKVTLTQRNEINKSAQEGNSNLEITDSTIPTSSQKF